MGLLQRSWQNAIAACLVPCAFEAEFLGPPGGLHGFDVFVLDVVAPLEVHPKRVVLALQVAGAQPQRDTATGENIQRGNRTGCDERIAVRQYKDPGLQP